MLLEEFILSDTTPPEIDPAERVRMEAAAGIRFRTPFESVSVGMDRLPEALTATKREALAPKLFAAVAGCEEGEKMVSLCKLLMAFAPSIKVSDFKSAIPAMTSNPLLVGDALAFAADAAAKVSGEPIITAEDMRRWAEKQ
jgi:hypothetical protein